MAKYLMRWISASKLSLWFVNRVGPHVWQLELNLLAGWWKEAGPLSESDPFDDVGDDGGEGEASGRDDAAKVLREDGPQMGKGCWGVSGATEGRADVMSRNINAAWSTEGSMMLVALAGLRWPSGCPEFMILLSCSRPW